MSPEFSQDFQDNRTWILEQMIMHQGSLEVLMYECADYCVNHNIINDVDAVIKTWEDWKERSSQASFNNNRL